jgi:hypothetical protein
VVPLSAAVARESAALEELADPASQRERITPVRQAAAEITLPAEPELAASPASRFAYTLPWKLSLPGELEWLQPLIQDSAVPITAALMDSQAHGLVSAMAAFGGLQAALDTDRQRVLPVHKTEPMWGVPALMQ